jgi:replicative DNA helicase
MIETKIDIERLIIAGALQSKSFLTIISSAFDAKYFDDRNVASIFLYIKSYLEKYNDIPQKAVILAELQTPEIQTIIDQIDAIEFKIADGYDHLFDITNKYLKDKALKTAIMDSVNVIEKKDKTQDSISDIIENALCKDLKIDLGMNYFENFNERVLRILKSEVIRIPTYFPQFDEFINGGFPVYTLSVITGRIHGFKSALMANLAARQVLHGHNVMFLTLEMSQDAFANRFDGLFSNLDINRILTVKEITKKMVAEIQKIKASANKGILYIKEFPTGEASVMDFKRYIRELTMRDIIPSIIYADYLNLMRPQHKRSKDDLYSDVKKISEEMRALSLEFNCPVITASQLNREGSFVSFEEAGMSYMSESYGVGATADFVGILGDNAEQAVYESEIWFKMDKNRLGGRVGDYLKLYYDNRSLKMYDANELDNWLEDSKISGGDRDIREKRDERPKPGRRDKR